MRKTVEDTDVRRFLTSFKPQSIITEELLKLVDEVEMTDMPFLAGVTARDGKLVLMMNDDFINATHATQEHVLRHEGGHIAGRHIQRRGDRNAILTNQIGDIVPAWLLATDAVVNECSGADVPTLIEAYRLSFDRRWPEIEARLKSEGKPIPTAVQLADARQGIGVITFEGLGIPVCPAEIAYDLLIEKAEKNGTMVGIGGCGCGHDLSKEDAAEWSKHKHKTLPYSIHYGVWAEQHGKLGGPRVEGASRQAPGVLENPPAWVQDVIRWLIDDEDSSKRRERLRSWRRTSRVDPDLPGRIFRPHRTRKALILIDVSGSVTADQAARFLAAVCATPELSDSSVRCFSDHLGELVPAYDVDAVRAQMEKHGGGTLIQAVGRAVMKDPSTPAQVVWITDAYSQDGFPPKDPSHLWVIHRGNDAEARIVDYPTKD